MFPCIVHKPLDHREAYEKHHHRKGKTGADEHAHKQAPGDPPGPVEDRPSVLPVATLGAGFVPESQREEMLDVIAQVFDPTVEQKKGRAAHKTKAIRSRVFG
jgi:hypothetical protein